MFYVIKDVLHPLLRSEIEFIILLIDVKVEEAYCEMVHVEDYADIIAFSKLLPLLSCIIVFIDSCHDECSVW